jgi:peptide/nickel transport system substrate-binding protein
MRTPTTRLAVVASAVLIAAAACGRTTPTVPPAQQSVSLADCDTKPTDCNSGPTVAGGTVVQALEKRLVNFNLNSAKGAGLHAATVLNGVLPSAFRLYPDNTARLNTDLLASAELTRTNPQTVVYKIQPNAVWDDGTPISAQDWQYAYRTLNGRDCPACDAVATTGYEQVKSVTGTDNDKTVTVVFDPPYPDWQGLFNYLYPAHLAKQWGDDGSAAGLAKAWEKFKTTVVDYSGWAYKVGEYVPDSSITLVPNPTFYGQTRPQLDKIVFRVVEDQPQELPAFTNKELNLLQSQPSQSILDQVSRLSGVDYAVTPGVAWEHVLVNEKNPYLSDVALRKAIFTAIDRKQLIAKTVSYLHDAQPLGNHMLLPGQSGYHDNVGVFGYGDGDLDAAKRILATAGYTVSEDGLKTKSGQFVPPLRFVYAAGNTTRQQAIEIMQSQLKPLGLTIAIDPTDDMGGALDNHGFDLILFAFVGGPFRTDNIDVWKTGGGSNFGFFSDPKADDLLRQVGSELDPEQSTDLLNRVDVLVSQAAADLPLFQKPNFLAVSHEFVNIRPNGTQMTSTYNIEQWARRAK